MLIKRLFIGSVLIFSALATGCKGLFGSETPSAPPPPPAPVVVDGVRTSYADVVERTSPAVVRIEIEHKEKASKVQAPGDDFFRQFQVPQQNQRPQIERGLGSGVIVDANGTILTNYHVIDGADKVTVRMSDNKSYQAKVVGSDQPSDLAVIKIEAENLPFLTLGDSDLVRVGDIVLAIGNPLGIGQTVTAGIISAKGRRTGLSDGQSFEDFLQTDAPINRGNSGGALVDLQGQLIGINSQILSPGGAAGGNIGIAFSIPSNMARSVLEQLLKDGKVHRGMLGVKIQNLTPDVAKAFDVSDHSGVIISSIQSGSAAEKAGLKGGDVITAINGEKVDDSNVVRNKIASTAPGTTVKLTIVRGGKEQEISATLDEFTPADNKNGPNSEDNDNGPGTQKESGKLGLSLEPMTPQLAKQLGVDNDKEGMVVTEVDPSGPSAEEGVSRGDVILEINKKAVNSVAEVQSALAASGENPILLLISRKGSTIYLTVKPD